MTNHEEIKNQPQSPEDLILEVLYLTGLNAKLELPENKGYKEEKKNKIKEVLRDFTERNIEYFNGNSNPFYHALLTIINMTNRNIANIVADYNNNIDNYLSLYKAMLKITNKIQQELDKLSIEPKIATYETIFLSYDIFILKKLITEHFATWPLINSQKNGNSKITNDVKNDITCHIMIVIKTFIRIIADPLITHFAPEEELSKNPIYQLRKQYPCEYSYKQSIYFSVCHNINETITRFMQRKNNSQSLFEFIELIEFSILLNHMMCCRTKEPSISLAEIQKIKPYHKNEILELLQKVSIQINQATDATIKFIKVSSVDLINRIKQMLSQKDMEQYIQYKILTIIETLIERIKLHEIAGKMAHETSNKMAEEMIEQEFAIIDKNADIEKFIKEGISEDKKKLERLNEVFEKKSHIKPPEPKINPFIDSLKAMMNAIKAKQTQNVIGDKQVEQLELECPIIDKNANIETYIKKEISEGKQKPELLDKVFEKKSHIKPPELKINPFIDSLKAMMSTIKDKQTQEPEVIIGDLNKNVKPKKK